MEFPVYVASDCHGVKLNVALRFDPHYDTLSTLFAAAQNAFALFTVPYANTVPLQPFAFAYIYSDVHCQWDLLQSPDQLCPLCQIYVFRHGCAEAIDAIPEPINSVLLLQQLQRREGSAGRSPSPVSSHLFAGRDTLARGADESSPFHALQAQSVAGPSSAAASAVEQSFSYQQTDLDMSSRTHTHQRSSRFQNTSLEDDSATRSCVNASALSTASFGDIHSRRFRLQLLSPALDPELRHWSISSRDKERNMIAAKPASLAPAVEHGRVMQRQAGGSSTPPTTPTVGHSSAPSHAQEYAVEVPRSWYTPRTDSRRPQREPHDTTPPTTALSSISRYGSSSHFDADHQFPPSAPQSVVATLSPPPSRRTSAPRVDLRSRLTTEALRRRDLGPPPLHPSSYLSAARAQRRLSGGSILREERERVDMRMHMDLDALRATLRDENRGYDRTIAEHPRYR